MHLTKIRKDIVIVEDDLSTFPFILVLSAEYATGLGAFSDSGGFLYGLKSIEKQLQKQYAIQKSY